MPKHASTQDAAYRLLTSARADAAKALPLVESWLHHGTEKSAAGLVRDALKALDAAIGRAAAGSF